MKVIIIPIGPYQTNCYIVYNEETRGCVIVDPGFEGKAILAELKKQDLRPEAIYLTHGHSDHIGGVEYIAKAMNIPVYINEYDEPMLQSPELNLSAKSGLDVMVQGVEVKLVNDGDVLTHANLNFKVITTPGHTVGGVCYYNEEGLLLAGDTLFEGSIGRTDFPRGSFEDLISSIKNKLYRLPHNTIVCPGHGGTTTIGAEISGNPFTR